MSTPSLRIALTKEERTSLSDYLSRIDERSAAFEASLSRHTTISQKREQIAGELEHLKVSTDALTGDWSTVAAVERQLAALQSEEAKAELEIPEAEKAFVDLFRYSIERIVGPILGREANAIHAQVTAAIRPFCNSDASATLLAKGLDLPQAAFRSSNLGLKVLGVSFDHAQELRSKIAALLDGKNAFLPPLAA
jgi:hypothetical protein